jgi:hypothetical protein
MTAGLALLATLDVNSATWLASAYMLVLGLGLGMVMQVLVLAVQNAVDYRDLGVATSGTTLFRSIGGSIGVAMFGAIFSSNLARGLAENLPAGTHLPSATEPSAIAALPPAVKDVYLHVFAAALHPVFLAAAVVGAVGFGLTWLLREVPLRGAVRAESIGESFAMPHDATSLEELAFIVTQLERKERHWQVYERIAQSLQIALAPDQIWMLIQLCVSEPVSLQALAIRFALPVQRLQSVAEHLLAEGMIARYADSRIAPTEHGRAIFQRMVDAHRNVLRQLTAQWAAERNVEAKAMLDRLARSLVANLPVAPSMAGR